MVLFLPQHRELEKAAAAAAAAEGEHISISDSANCLLKPLRGEKRKKKN